MAKILIAEDSATELAYLKEILEQTSHELVCAVNGQQAEDLVHTEKIDLILLDVVMPIKDGFRICRNLKKDERFKSIPILITTSKTGESDKYWGLKQGADEYITKPYTPETILAAVRKYLGGA